MKIINYISIIAMPGVILIIIFYALKEKINVFDIFLKFSNINSPNLSYEKDVIK